MPIQGDAGFKYTDPVAGAVTFALEAPLREIAAAVPTTLFTHESADGTAWNTVRVGSTTVDEITARLRYENDVTGLKALLRNGLDKVTLNYYPSLADTLTFYACKLVSVNGGTEAAFDPDTDLWFQSRYECRLRLRRVDGSTFDALLEGS